MARPIVAVITLAVLCLVSIPAAATSGQPASSTQSQAAPPDAATRACEARPRYGTRVLGRVFFGGEARPGWEQGDRMQSSRYPGGRRFSKLGLLVRGAEPVVLRIREGIRAWIKGWSADEPTRTLAIDPQATERCGGKWRVFYGGFLFVEPRCLMLRVDVGERSATVPFGLGMSC